MAALKISIMREHNNGGSSALGLSMLLFVSSSDVAPRAAAQLTFVATAAAAAPPPPAAPATHCSSLSVSAAIADKRQLQLLGYGCVLIRQYAASRKPHAPCPTPPALYPAPRRALMHNYKDKL